MKSTVCSDEDLIGRMWAYSFVCVSRYPENRVSDDIHPDCSSDAEEIGAAITRGREALHGVGNFESVELIRAERDQLDADPSGRENNDRR
jgi:hypothetical protein